MATMKDLTQNGGVQVAPKNRERLTVYVDSELLERFKMESDSMYRNWSDHMNAILSEYYNRKDSEGAASKSIGGSG